MGTYREQLLRETYGRDSGRIYGKEKPEEMSSGFLTVWKLRLVISLLLFGGFVYLSVTGNSFCNMTAEQIVETVTADEDFVAQLADF